MCKILMTNPLFNGLNEGRVKSYLEKIEVRRKCFKKNTMAFHSMSTEKHIMFMTKGCAKVEQYHEDGSSIFLKRLMPGDVFGILSIFNSSAYYPTHIIFEEESEVVCITEGEVFKLIKQDEQLIHNFFEFFNRQVLYLLDRIALFSIQSIEERVLQYFIGVEDQNATRSIKMSKVELSEFLGISRASLYRIIDKLVDEERIVVKGKHIQIR